ncbi:hypothetical protein CVT24_005184 [Panaeolus cyanescens]|uniref:Survival Motor Neuron Gemin2-binding domain-containing protein n=1 Tax=Panaeolus cyanescens TaxID=181874 RepID=A0A409Y9F5_9AGAR|nr:hypothetical protein CVT24_005184 [Panaeolus cyanescens]
MASRPIISYDDITLPYDAPSEPSQTMPHSFSGAVTSTDGSAGGPPTKKRKKNNKNKHRNAVASQKVTENAHNSRSRNHSMAESSVTIADSYEDDEGWDEGAEQEESRELTHEEIWDDSALVDAWDAAMEEYEMFHGPGKAWKNEPIKKSPLWYNIPPSSKGSIPPAEAEAPAEDGGDQEDSQPLNFDTFVPTHDPSLEIHAPAPHSSMATRPMTEDYVPSSASIPMVSRDEAFQRALNAMYWGGYWTAMYHAQSAALDKGNDQKRKVATGPVEEEDSEYNQEGDFTAGQDEEMEDEEEEEEFIDTQSHERSYPVYPHEQDFSNVPKSHSGYRNPEFTWGTRSAGHHEDYQNTQHYGSAAKQPWDDLEDDTDGESLLRPPPPKHMQTQHNRSTVLSTITESSFAQPSIRSAAASMDEGGLGRDRGRGVWDLYEGSPTLDPNRGWEDAPQRWRNQLSGHMRHSDTPESPPPRSTQNSLGSQGGDRDSQDTPPSSASRSISQSTAPPSTPPQSQPYNGPKPFLPYGPCRPPARIPSDPSWIMTGGNAWAQGLRDKFAEPKSFGTGAGAWGDQYRRQDQQQERDKPPDFFSFSPPTHRPPKPPAKPQPIPSPASLSSKQSHPPYSLPAQSRAHHSYSSLPRPSVIPPPLPVPPQSLHPMAIWHPKGAKSVPDSIHKHSYQPNVSHGGSIHYGQGGNGDDDDDMYVSASEERLPNGPNVVQNEEDVTFVDEWDRVHDVSLRPPVETHPFTSPNQQHSPQQHQQHAQVPFSSHQQHEEDLWNNHSGEQVWRNHHMGHPTSENPSEKPSLFEPSHQNQSYSARWQQHHRASDSNPIPVWRTTSTPGQHPPGGPVVIAPSETTWVPPDMSWDPGDDNIAPWRHRAPSNNLTHLGPLQDLRTRYRPNATMVMPDPPAVPVQVKKSKKKWWKIFSKSK